MTAVSAGAVVGTPDSQAQAPPVRGATSTTSSKLRDSCHACALSKVKCHKEKPTCSRCARRGITCEYFVTKRPGRKREKTQPINDSNGDTIHVVRPDPGSGQDPWLDNAASTNYSTLSANHNYSTSLDHFSPTSPRPGSVSGAKSSSSISPSGMFSGPLMPLDPSISSEFVGMSNEFDDNFFTSPIDFLDDFGFIQGHDDLENFLIPNSINPDPVSETSSIASPSISKALSLSSNSGALSSSNTSVASGPGSTCCCLLQALDLMKKLSPSKSPVCVLSNNSNDDTTMTDIPIDIVPSAQIVVMENKLTIEAVSNMLQCSCAEDSYLLTMLSMIVFKILGRYAAAAKKQEGSNWGDSSIENTSAKEQMRQISSWCLGGGGEGFERIAAQLILSELHRVQQLMNQLSPRLKARRVGLEAASKGSGRGFPSSRNSSSGGDYQVSSLLESGSKAAPFSNSTLDQMEIDLRKCLSTLSSEIINMLRQS